MLPWVLCGLAGFAVAEIGAAYLSIGWEVRPGGFLPLETAAVICIVAGGFVAGFSGAMAVVAKWGKR